MEKYGISGLQLYRHRLLTSLVVFTLLVPSLCFGAVSLRNLKIVPEKSSCFVGDTCNFILEIPEYLPSRIDVTVQSTPDGVALMASSKDSYEVDGVKGTRIVFTFKFSKKGTYKIPSLATRVDWISINIPFQSITVYDDPRTLLPEISIKLPKTIYAQESFVANVSMRFFSEILEVYSDLDENVIITRSENTEILPLSQKEFTENYESVASYDLTPIEAGTLTVPAFHVLAKTYAGGQVLLSSEPQTVKVLAAKKQIVSETGNSYYASVLDGSETDDDAYEDDSSAEFSDDSLFFEEGSSPEEIAIGLVETRNCEKAFLIASLVLFILCAAAAIIFFVKRFKLLSKIATSSFIIFLAAFIVFFILTAGTKGVASHNTSVYSIPEQNSSSVSVVIAGEIMRVKAVRSGWYSVKLVNGSEGWIRAEDCIYCGN